MKSVALVPVNVNPLMVNVFLVRFASVRVRGELGVRTTWPKKSIERGAVKTPVAAVGDSFTTKGPPVLKVVWKAPGVTMKSAEAVIPVM